MKRIVQLVGNGDNASLFFKEPRPGMKLTCNLPPFNVAGVYATVIVDFKFMKAIQFQEMEKVVLQDLLKDLQIFN